MALEDLERELFGAKRIEKKAKRATKTERPVFVSSPIPPPLAADERPPTLTFEERMKLITRSVILAAVTVLVVAAAVGGGLYYFFSREASRGIVLSIEAPAEVMSGVPFDLTIIAENEIDGIAREASVSVKLPDGITALGVLSGSSALIEEAIGDIGGRSVARKTFRLIAVGDSGDERAIEAAITYFSGGRSRFKAEEEASVTIGEPAIHVSVEAPERVIGNSSFEFTVGYENTSPFDFTGTVLEMRYPPEFSFESASLPPDSLNNYWRLGALNANSKGRLIIKGSVVSAGATVAKFPIAVSANFFGKDFTILETEAEVALAPSPLLLSIRVNGSETHVAQAGGLLTYTIHYENQSGVALADVVVRATLAGEMFEGSSVGTIGRVDTAARTVTWDAGVMPQLRMLDAGAWGELVLAVPLKASFPIRRLSDKNFSVRLAVNAESPTVPSYLTANKTVAIAAAETKLAGLTLVDAKAFHRDAPSGIVNQGTLPPRTGISTDYTVHWVVRNFSTDVERVTVRAALPPDVAWTGIVKSNGDSIPLFEESTREVVWTIDKIAAGKGVVNAPLEAIFQVRATPLASHVGSYQPILFDTALAATDAWTGTAISSRDGALTTSLEDDNTVAPGDGRVVP